MIIKMKSLSGVFPEYETPCSSGMDLRAHIDGPVTIESWERKLIPTGIFIEMESDFEIQIRARSGLAIKNGIGLINGIGTIDSDYRGEIKIPLINMSNEPFTVNDGDRIAQMVVCRVERAEIERVSSVQKTERGSGGFGHTGIL